MAELSLPNTNKLASYESKLLNNELTMDCEMLLRIIKSMYLSHYKKFT